MCRGKSSLAFLLWWNILKKNLTKEGLSADVYAEGERERKKKQAKGEGGREKDAEHAEGEKHRKAEAVGTFSKGKKCQNIPQTNHKTSRNYPSNRVLMRSSSFCNLNASRQGH